MIAMATTPTRFSKEYDEGVYWRSLRAMARVIHSIVHIRLAATRVPARRLSGYLPLGQSIIAGRVVIGLYALVGIVAIYVIGRRVGAGLVC
jgi:hypothetical protein